MRILALITLVCTTLFTGPAVGLSADDHGSAFWPSAFEVGSPLPPATLQVGSDMIRMDTLGTNAPVILVRYLGFGCTHCVQQLTYLNDHAAALRELGIRVVAFSEDDQWTSERMIGRMHYDRSVLTIANDPENRAALQGLKAIRQTGDEVTDLHVAMVVSEGTVRFSRYTEQPYLDVEQLVSAAVHAARPPASAAGFAESANALDRYLSGTPTVVAVAGPADGIVAPLDLDFNQSPLHPDDLWVVTTDSRGHAIAIVHHATSDDRTVRLKKDSRASHFMWRTQAIAMGSNGTFATMQSGQNGNMDPFYQFMGPTLWSSDTAVFASRYQADNRVLASHLDMLHQSPMGLGIAHDHDNVYWVSDGYYNTIHRYDFADPHEVGGTDHRDGRIRRYTDASVTLGERGRPGHLALDDAKQWLYIVDPGGNRVLRMDVTTGARQRNLVPPDESGENLAEFTEWSGATVEELISSGIGEPVGIEVYADRLLVGDRLSGTIHVFAITPNGVERLGQIATQAQELLGICVGPDQRIWFVDRGAGTVNRLDTELERTLQATVDVNVVSASDTVSFLAGNPGTTPWSFTGLVILTPVSADGSGRPDTVATLDPQTIPAGETVEIAVEISIPDTLSAWTVTLIDDNGTVTGGARAATTMVYEGIRKVIADDALMETFRITEAVAQTDRTEYVSLRSDIFTRAADRLPELQVVLWNGGSAGEISVTDDAVLRSLIERDVEVFLIADDPLLLRADLPGTVEFFRSFGASVRGADLTPATSGQRIFTGVAGDPVSGGLALVDCQLPRLDHHRGGDYIPNVLFRTTTDGVAILARQNTDNIGAVRYERDYRRSVLLGINAARFLDGLQRTQILDQGLAWLEGAAVREPVDTTVSVREEPSATPEIAMRLLGTGGTATTVELVGTAADVHVAVYTVGGQQIADLYHGPLHGLMTLPVELKGAASGTLFIIARTATSITHRTLVRH